MNRVLFVTVLIIFVLSLLGCTGTGNSSIREAERRIVVGLAADYPPFESKKNGEIIGFDVDLAREIAKELGYELTLQDMEFSALIPSLQTGRIDFAMSGMTVTEERKKNLLFSDTYYTSSFSVIFQKSGPFSSEQDLAGKKIGVQLGTTMEKYAKAKAKIDPTIQVISLAKNPVLIQELKSGRLQGVISEDVQAIAFVEANPELGHALLAKTGDGYAIGFQREKGLALRDSVNQVIHKLKNSKFLDKLKQKWLRAE